jgi:hypothetical protein
MRRLAMSPGRRHCDSWLRWKIAAASAASERIADRKKQSRRRVLDGRRLAFSQSDFTDWQT